MTMTCHAERGVDALCRLQIDGQRIPLTPLPGHSPQVSASLHQDYPGSNRNSLSSPGTIV
jgi:hypothetical protein